MKARRGDGARASEGASVAKTGPRGRPVDLGAPRAEGRAGHEEHWIQDRWLAPLLEPPELRQIVRRGKILARKSVRELKIRSGLLSAEVASDSGELHSVKVRMDPIDSPTWVAVVDAISDEAALAADLIRGRMSERLAEIFEEAGHDLFPFDLRDVSSYCSCREDVKVCTGAVATHFHFAEVIQADPMKLLAFRGRDKAWLEEEVRERRKGASPAAARSKERGPAEGATREATSGKPGKAQRSGDWSSESSELAAALRDGFWARGELPNLAFHLERERLGEEDAFPIVRALGPGPGGTPPEEVANALFPVLRTLRLKLEHIRDRVEHELEAPPPELADVPEVEPLDQLLLDAAKRQGHLTTTTVAQALGVSAREAREYLQFLVNSGKLAIVGRARGTRYVPVAADEGATPRPEGQDVLVRDRSERSG